MELTATPGAVRSYSSEFLQSKPRAVAVSRTTLSFGPSNFTAKPFKLAPMDTIRGAITPRASLGDGNGSSSLASSVGSGIIQ